MPPRHRAHHRSVRQRQIAAQSFGLGGGSSRAAQESWKPVRACDPSQKGLFADCPQRHSEITVRPASPNWLPCASHMEKSPSMRIGPLFNGVILVDMPRMVTCRRVSLAASARVGGATPWRSHAPSCLGYERPRQNHLHRVARNRLRPRDHPFEVTAVAHQGQSGRRAST